MTGRTVAIVGGGKVPCRKCKELLEHNAIVRVIASELAPDFKALSGQLELIKDFDESLLTFSFMVIAATDNGEINKCYKDCRALAGIRIAAIGAGTAVALAKYGNYDVIEANQPGADGIIRALKQYWNRSNV